MRIRDPTADFHVVIGDESALPAVATVLAALPAGAPGMAFLEVADPDEEQELPGDATVRWVHRRGRQAGTPLVAAVRTATFPDGVGHAWLSGESAAVKELRRHLLAERAFDRRRVYATGYWRAR